MGGFPRCVPSTGALISVIVILLMGALPGPLQADPAAGQVSWSEVLDLVDRHPSLAASRHRVEAAQGGEAASLAVPNPTLSATLGEGLARDEGAARLEWGVELSLPLDWTVQRQARRRCAQAGEEEARALAEAQRLEVLQRLGALFWTVAAGQAKVALLEEAQGQTAQLVATVERRVDKGEARPGEATRIAIELDKISSELDAERVLLAALRSQLGLWLGAPGEMGVSVAADLGTPQAQASLERPASNLRDSHPLTAALEARVRARQADVTVERRARAPAWALVGYALSELDRTAYGGGLTVDLPLWSWNRGRIAQAEATLAAQRAQSQADLLELESAMLTAQAACRSAVTASARLGSGMLPRAATVASAAQRAYELGEAGLLELIDARRTFLEARRLHLDSLSKAQIECSRLAGLTGEELP